MSVFEINNNAIFGKNDVFGLTPVSTATDHWQPRRIPVIGIVPFG